MIDEKKLIKFIEESGDEYRKMWEKIDSEYDFGGMNACGSIIAYIEDMPKVGEWIPVTERLPEECEAVNVTWVNHNPESYYADMKGKPNVDTAVYYAGHWYWWNCVIQDILKEYGEGFEADKIDGNIEVTAWQPLPEPYRGDTDDSTV